MRSNPDDMPVILPPDPLPKAKVGRPKGSTKEMNLSAQIPPIRIHQDLYSILYQRSDVLDMPVSKYVRRLLTQLAQVAGDTPIDIFLLDLIDGKKSHRHKQKAEDLGIINPNPVNKESQHD